MPEGTFKSIDDVQDEKCDALVDLAGRIAARNEADVIVLAGAPLAGLASKVGHRVPLPVIDCAEAAICQAETLARLRPAPARAGSFGRPAAKLSVGLKPALAARIAHTDC